MVEPDELHFLQMSVTLRDGGVGTVEHACVRIYAHHGHSKLEIDLSHWCHEGIDLLFTIRTLNRVVDSKVSSWDPKLAADLVNSVRAVINQQGGMSTFQNVPTFRLANDSCITRAISFQTVNADTLPSLD